MPAPQRDHLIFAELRQTLAGSWRRKARPEQLPPPGDWLVWLFMAGRGAGKTRAGSEWVHERVLAGTASRIALVAATAADVRDVMVEGPSGILAASIPPARFAPREAGFLCLFCLSHGGYRENLRTIWNGPFWRVIGRMSAVDHNGDSGAAQHRSIGGGVSLRPLRLKSNVELGSITALAEGLGLAIGAPTCDADLCANELGLNRRYSLRLGCRHRISQPSS